MHAQPCITGGATIAPHLMCGRYKLGHPSELQLRFGEDDWAEIRIPPSVPMELRYNVAPTQSVPIIVQSPKGERQILAARWDFQPPWIKENGKRPAINAKAETLASRPMWTYSAQKLRCLIPADGFYEWMTIGPKLKLPYHIRLRGAGIGQLVGPGGQGVGVLAQRGEC